MGVGDLFTPSDPQAYAAQQAASPAGAPPPPPAPVGVSFPAASGGFQPTGPAITPAQALQMAQLGPSAARPGGWAPASRQTQVQQGTPLDPAAKAALEQQQAAYAEEQSAGTDLAAQQAKAQAGKLAATADFDESDLARKQARWDDQAQQLASYHKGLQGALDEAAKPDDPKKWWHDKSGFDKVATGVNVILRGLSFGISHGQGEDPSQWIERQIQDSVTSQRAAKSDDVKSKSAGYQLLKDQLGDEDRTHLASEMAHRQTVISYLDAKAAEQQLPAQARFTAAKLSADLSQNQAKTLADLDEKTADKVTTSSHDVHVQATTGGGQDILARLQRANAIKAELGKLTGTGPEADKERAALEAELATTEKTRAETDKDRAAAGPGEPLVAPKEAGGWANSFLPKNWQSDANKEANRYNSQLALRLGIKSARGLPIIEHLQLRPGMSDEQVKATVEAGARAVSAANKGKPGAGGAAAPSDDLEEVE